MSDFFKSLESKINEEELKKVASAYTGKEDPTPEEVLEVVKKQAEEIKTCVEKKDFEKGKETATNIATPLSKVLKF